VHSLPDLAILVMSSFSLAFTTWFTNLLPYYSSSFQLLAIIKFINPAAIIIDSIWVFVRKVKSCTAIQQGSVSHPTYKSTESFQDAGYTHKNSNYNRTGQYPRHSSWSESTRQSWGYPHSDSYMPGDFYRGIQYGWLVSDKILIIFSPRIVGSMQPRRRR